MRLWLTLETDNGQYVGSYNIGSFDQDAGQEASKLADLLRAIASYLAAPVAALEVQPSSGEG